MSKYGWTVEQPDRLHLLARGSCSALGVTFCTSAPFPPAGTTLGQAALEQVLRDEIARDEVLADYLRHRSEQPPPPQPQVAAPPMIPVPAMILQAGPSSLLPGQRVEGVAQPAGDRLPASVRSRLRAILDRIAAELAAQADADVRAAVAAIAEVAGPQLDRLAEALSARQRLSSTHELMPSAVRLLESIHP